MSVPIVPTLTPTIVGIFAANKNLPSLAGVLQAAAVDGDAFALQGKEVLVIQNGSGGSIDVTITSAPDNFGNHYANDDMVITVADGEFAVVGPLAARLYADSLGLAQIGYSDPTDVLVGLLTFATTS